MIELDNYEESMLDFDNHKNKYNFVKKHAKTELLEDVLTKLMWACKVKVKNNEFEVDLTEYAEEETETNSHGW